MGNWNRWSTLLKSSLKFEPLNYRPGEDDWVRSWYNSGDEEEGQVEADKGISFLGEWISMK